MSDAVPTLTAVFPSSSEALLPPLLMLIRLELLGDGRIIALIGLCEAPEGDAGGEVAMAYVREVVAKLDGCSVQRGWKLEKTFVRDGLTNLRACAAGL